MTRPLILGVDPGLRNLGLALVRGREVVDARTVRHEDADMPLSVRLSSIAIWLLQWTRELKTLATLDAFPPAIAYESQWQAQVGQMARGQSTHKSAQGLTVVGIIIGIAHALDLKLIELTPAEVKKAVLCPLRASKADVKRAVQGTCTNVPKRLSQHTADAIACACAGGMRVR